MAVGVTLGGKYVGIDPSFPDVIYANRTALGAWEEVVITPHAQWSDIRFTASNRQLAVSEITHHLLSRDAGDIDVWGGQWAISADGKTATCDVWTLALEGYTPPAVNVPLSISGMDFVNPDGSRRVLCGCDMFLAYRQFLDGGAAALVPFWDESHALGFDLWRVFLMGSKRQNQVMDLSPSEPGYYDQLQPFVQTLNNNGIVLLATVFVDAQDVMPSETQRQSHWTAVAERLRGSNTLLSYGNERNKNGTEHDQMTDPGMIWSRGSWTADPSPYQPVPQNASFAEFHPRRDLYKSLADATASPITIWQDYHVTCPLVIDEPPKFGTNGTNDLYNDPKLARKFAQVYSAMCAGAVYHNWFGQRGLLMDGPTITVGQAWQRGMHL